MSMGDFRKLDAATTESAKQAAEAAASQKAEGGSEVEKETEENPIDFTFTPILDNFNSGDTFKTYFPYESESEPASEATFEYDDYFGFDPQRPLGFEIAEPESSIDAYKKDEKSLDELSADYAIKENEVDDLAPPREHMEQYRKEDGTVDSNAYFEDENKWMKEKKESYEKAKKELDEIKQKLDDKAKEMDKTALETGVSKAGAKFYENTGEKADAVKNGIVNENFKILSEGEQIAALHSLNINTNNYDVKISDDGTPFLQSKDGSQFYKVGINPDTGNAQVISTKVVDGNFATELYNINYAQNPDAAGSGYVSSNFQVSDEAGLKDTAGNLNINMDNYNVETNAKGEVFLKSKDGNQYYKVGTDAETGKKQLVSTKQEGSVSSTKVIDLPQTNLSELKEKQTNLEAKLKELAPPDENDQKYSSEIFFRKTYSTDMKNWRNEKSADYNKAKEELDSLNKQIKEWTDISKQIN